MSGTAMATSRTSGPNFWRTRNGALLAAAVLSSVLAWWMIAWPVASLANRADHQGHFLLTFAHMVGGTGALFLGALNLYLAARKNRFRLHRRIGQSYLLLGAFGARPDLGLRLLPDRTRTTDIDQLGNGEAFIWLSWVAPLILCEIALQWRHGGRQAAR